MKKIKIFLVDDDTLFLKALEIEFLKNTDFITECFSTGENCLENLNHNPDVIILDYHLNGIEINAMNGLEVLVKIKTYNQEIPVIMLSSQDKIEIAINCMHNKAYDYVVKSETAFVRLQKILNTIIKYKKMETELKWYMDKL
jgi:DNA-binding NtrC family response regulator